MDNPASGLDILFNPRSVAVIGASNNWNKWGYSTFVNLTGSFAGPVYPVNRREEAVLGCRAYRSVLDIEGDVDLAVFVIPAPAVPDAMRDCVRKGVRTGVIISAGFRETGPEGRALENEVLRIAREGGLRFVGPNCMGLWSAPARLRAYMFALPSMDGPAAFVTQGGNVGGSIMTSAYERGLGFRRYVSCGPAADIQLEDYLAHFGQDDEVKVVLAYIEGLSDGKRFLDTVSQVCLKKPVIVYKPGRSEAVAKAILSHSGSLAGSDEIFDKAMRKAGVTRVHSPEELLDTAIGFLTQPLPKGRNVGIVTGGGSFGVICAEDCAAAGLEVPELPEPSIEALSAIFPPRWSRGNPVDPAGDRNFIAYYLAPKIILELDGIDALIFMGFGSLAGISRMLRSGGQKVFVHHIPEMLSGIEGSTELIGEVADALLAGDSGRVRGLVDPWLPFVALLFGSDVKTVDAFMDILLSSPVLRRALAKTVSAFSLVARQGEAGLEKILELLDDMIALLMAHYLLTYRKPILSTSFSEMPQPIKGASHPYTTSAKAVSVLSKLVDYREHLERAGAFRHELQLCTLLNRVEEGRGAEGDVPAYARHQG
ncbi:MAG TPA: CoA-binding protein [Deltaproteobacteria bacterium]|nr:CoA-binding protein [Deltaproteobacteria bacterium]HOI06166.1 CoA-binding protein [Deltaproteobacteria bacterium]